MKRLSENNGQKITPFLWFDGNAEEAMLQMVKLDIKTLRAAYPGR